jgi:hypothetical protein
MTVPAQTLAIAWEMLWCGQSAHVVGYRHMHAVASETPFSSSCITVVTNDPVGSACREQPLLPLANLQPASPFQHDLPPRIDSGLRASDGLWLQAHARSSAGRVASEPRSAKRERLGNVMQNMATAISVLWTSADSARSRQRAGWHAATASVAALSAAVVVSKFA